MYVRVAKVLFSDRPCTSVTRYFITVRKLAQDILTEFLADIYLLWTKGEPFDQWCLGLEALILVTLCHRSVGRKPKVRIECMVLILD